MSNSPSARQVIESLVDEATFESWDTSVGLADLTDDHRAQVERAMRRAECDEAVLTGSAAISDRRVALVVSEFAFMGGSVGTRAATRLIAAINRATDEGLPLIAAPASGGTRMQDGAAGFVAMVGIVAALRAHARRGLPYFVYLRNPTTGGTLASWGSLGHLTLAQPRAFIGLLGPAITRALGGEISAGTQRSESLLEHRRIDLIADVDDARVVLARALELVLEPRLELPVARLVDAEAPALSSWDSVVQSRSTREDVNDIVDPDVSVFLRGSGGGKQPLLMAITRFHGRSCLVIGHDRQAEMAGRRLGPGALRDARKVLRVAEELRLPVVTMIDTAGAELSDEAESGGLAAEIAEFSAALGALPTPTVSVLLGEGAGGGAIALFPASRQLALPAAWLSPLPPEGASQLVHGTTTEGATVADAQRIGTTLLLDDGLIDAIVSSPDQLAAAIASAVDEQEARA